MRSGLLGLLFLILWSNVTTTTVTYELPNSDEVLENALNSYDNDDDDNVNKSCKDETGESTNQETVLVEHEGDGDDNYNPTWYEKVSKFGNKLKEKSQKVKESTKSSSKQSDSFSSLASMDHYNHQEQATSGGTTNSDSNDHDGDFNWSLNFDFVHQAEDLLTKVSSVLQIMKTSQHTPSTTTTTDTNTNNAKRNDDDDGFMKLLEYISREATDQHDNDDDYTIMQAIKIFKVAFNEAMDQFQRNELNALLTTTPHMALSDLKLHLIAFWYFLRNEEEKKDSVWKRKVHYYDPKLYDISTLNRLHSVLYLSRLSYADTEKDIYDNIKKFENNTWKVLHATTISKPKEPAHYILIKKQASGVNKIKYNHDDSKKKKRRLFRNVFRKKKKKSKGDDYIEVTIVVRGTKALADVFTDLITEPVPYRGYHGHAGVIESAKNLVNKHGPKLVELLKLSGRKYIKLWVIGHSLGAGTAAIMAIEFEEEYAEYIEARSIGFGTPPVLSPELSTKYKDVITTIISDADCVPRLSPASITNLLLDIIDFDWSHYALDDVEPFLLDLRKYVPPIFGKDLLSDEFIYNNFLVWMNDYLNNTVQATINERKKVKEEQLNILKSVVEENSTTMNVTNNERNSIARSSSSEYRVPSSFVPPGNCIHLFRDGPGVTGSFTPCDFFSEIEFVPTFISDHLIPPGYHTLILGLARDIAKDLDYKFPHDIMSLPIK